jgi:hypothetical protein
LVVVVVVVVLVVQARQIRVAGLLAKNHFAEHHSKSHHFQCCV